MEGDDIPLYAFFGTGRSLALARDYAAGEHQAAHRHDVPQLLHATRGVMRVTTPDGYWVIPPGRGVWIPASVPHEICMVGPVSMCTLYVADAQTASTDGACMVVAISDLLRCLLRELSTFDPRGSLGDRQRAIEHLVLIELANMQRLPFHVAIPRDKRLRKLCIALLAQPQDARTLDEHADRVGASGRTLRRLFQQELGMSFAEWRQQVRLMEALARLSEGGAVATVARDLGYATPSAFIAMFRRSLGQSPRSYLRDAPQAAGPRVTG